MRIGGKIGHEYQGRFCPLMMNRVKPDIVGFHKPVRCFLTWVRIDIVHRFLSWGLLTFIVQSPTSRQIPCDYIPRRSYPLLSAGEMLRLLAREAEEGSLQPAEQPM